MKLSSKSYTFTFLAIAIVIICLIGFSRFEMQQTHVAQTDNFSLNSVTANPVTASPSSPDPSLQWLQKHYGKSVNILKSFTAGKNLRGFLVSLKANPETHSIIYSVNHGQYFIVGTLINHKGENVSLLNANHYISSPESKAIYMQAQKLKGIKQGSSSAPEVTVIIDPNSNVFPEQWNEFSYDVAQGEFSVKWVLVNYLKPLGPNTAAKILQAKDPVKALHDNAMRYSKLTQTGGYSSAQAVSKQSLSTLQKHWSFVQKHNLYQLPITIMKHKGKYYVIHGVAIDETLENIFTS